MYYRALAKPNVAFGHTRARVPRQGGRVKALALGIGERLCPYVVHACVLYASRLARSFPLQLDGTVVRRFPALVAQKCQRDHVPCQRLGALDRRLQLRRPCDGQFSARLALGEADSLGIQIGAPDLEHVGYALTRTVQQVNDDLESRTSGVTDGCQLRVGQIAGPLTFAVAHDCEARVGLDYLPLNGVLEHNAQDREASIAKIRRAGESDLDGRDVFRFHLIRGELSQDLFETPRDGSVLAN